MNKVRAAVAFLERHYRSRHPLAEHDFETDGIDLFIQQAGLLINLSQDGQLAMRDLVESYLRRIDRDEKGPSVSLHTKARTRRATGRRH